MTDLYPPHGFPLSYHACDTTQQRVLPALYAAGRHSLGSVARGVQAAGRRARAQALDARLVRAAAAASKRVHFEIDYYVRPLLLQRCPKSTLPVARSTT